MSSTKAVTDDHVCVEVHPCRVNKTLRIAASEVMDYLESFAGLLDNLNWILLKHTKISVSAMACFLVGSRGRHHSGVLNEENVVDSCTLLTSSLVLVVQD